MSGVWTNVDFLPGKVTWMENVPQEDMLQVEYPNNFILDMGWYVDKYIINVIKDFEWSDPVAQYATQDAEQLVELLAKAVERIKTKQMATKATLEKLNG